jgi:hypothetical protein
MPRKSPPPPLPDEFEELLVWENGKVRHAAPGEYVAERTMRYLLAMEAAIRKAWRLGDLRLAMEGLQTLLRLGPLGRTRIDLAAITATDPALVEAVSKLSTEHLEALRRGESLPQLMDGDGGRDAPSD